MPLIPNYVSRFRTQSQSTAATGSSVNTASESRSASTLEPPLTEASTANSTTLQPIEELERKINPGPDVLVAEPDASLLSLHSIDPQRKDESTGPGQLVAAEQPVKETSQYSQLDPPEGTSNSPSFISKILTSRSTQSEANVSSSDSHNTPVSLPNWATFGRKGVPLIPRINEFGSLYRRGGNDSSSKGSSLKQQATPPSSTSTPHPPSQPSPSPAGTVSSSSGSKAYSQHSHSLRSRRQPLIHPDPIPDGGVDGRRSTSHAQTSTVASNTFGRGAKRPTEIDNDQQADYSDTDAAADLFIPTRTSTPPPPERLVRHQPPWTYPPPSRKRSLPKGGSVSFPTLAKKKSRRSVTNVFGDHDENRPTNTDLFAAAALATQASGLPEAEDESGLQKEQDHDKIGSVDAGELKNDSAVGKNPSFFGSVGRDRQAFLRAGRRKTIPAGMTPGMSSLSSPGETHATPSSTDVDSAGGMTFSSTVFPRVSRSRPLSATPVVVKPNNMSDPELSLTGSAFDIMDIAGSSVKRKMSASQDDVTMQPSSSGTMKGILLNPKRESSRPSDASHAPSSYRQPKRIRLSTPGASGSSSPPTHTRSLSPNHPHLSPPHSPTSISRPASSLRSFSSQASSIPVRAIVSPRPPSVVSRNSMYHMRDPGLAPSRRESTQWKGAARAKLELGEQGGPPERVFPLQAWAFVIGFVLFPVWWIAAVMPVEWGWTRRKGVQDGKGKGEWDDEDAVRETLEYDVAYTWRQRCRVVSVLGLFVYIPLIVLLAVFVPRGKT